MIVHRRLASLGFLVLAACGDNAGPGGGVSGASSFVIDGRIYIARDHPV